MPKFTIETTYDLPVYRHRTYYAETFEDACAAALVVDDWNCAKQDYENARNTRLTGAWEGDDTAYTGKALPLPPLTAAGDQKPVRYQRKSPTDINGDGWTEVNEEDIQHHRNIGQEIRALYTAPVLRSSPPAAPVTVSESGTRSLFSNAGWFRYVKIDGRRIEAAELAEIVRKHFAALSASPSPVDSRELIERLVKALASLRVQYSPPQGKSINQATVEKAQEIVRAALAAKEQQP